MMMILALSTMEYVLSISLLILTTCSNTHQSLTWIKQNDTDELDLITPTNWFVQKLNNFDIGNADTWRQRYLVNEQFFNKKQEFVFLHIGGLHALDLQMTGQWTEYGKKFSALLFSLEHRFYGKSQPTSDLSLESLKYLTSQQALADIAYFIQAMNTKYNLSSKVKWVLFGCSYAGALAAWARLRYPHLIQGAVSSSASLQAVANFQAIGAGNIRRCFIFENCMKENIRLRNILGYLQVVADDIQATNPKCRDVVKAGFNKVQELVLKKDVKDLSYLTRLFDLCDPLDTDANDIANLLRVLSFPFREGAEYGNSITLNEICKNLTATPDDPVKLLSGVVTEFNRAVYDDTCLDFKYVPTVEPLKIITWSSDNRRQILFQQCNEFGFFKTTDQKDPIFGNLLTLDQVIKKCSIVFGVGFDRRYIESAVNSTNVVYGGLDIKVSNVAFVQGSLDPWKIQGITNALPSIPSSTVIIIKGAHHCEDVLSPSADDSPELKQAKATIEQSIQNWLK